MMEVAKPIRREQCTNIFSNIDSNKVWTYMDCGKGTNVFGLLGPISTTLVFHRYHNTKVLCPRLLEFWWHIPKNESVSQWGKSNLTGCCYVTEASSRWWFGRVKYIPLAIWWEPWYNEYASLRPILKPFLILDRMYEITTWVNRICTSSRI